MIKIQPSHSRIRKSESSERITLTMPARGVFGSGGVLILGSLLWVAVTLYLIVVSLLRHTNEFALFSLIAMLPAFVALAAGISESMKSWSIERDSSWVTLRKRGLFGPAEQRWPVGDVASFFPQSVPTADAERPEAWLGMGLRNGRSITLVRDDYEEISWAAAVLRDPRGTRKLASVLQLAAEPERRKIDPAIAPVSLICRTFDGTVEMVFRPLLQVRGLWWKLPLIALGAVAGVLVAAGVVYVTTKSPAVPVVARLSIVGIIGWTGWRLWVLQGSGVITIADGIVTIRQNQRRDTIEFGKVDVEFVQTYRTPGHVELQFLLKGIPKVRLFDGRPGDELEWAARFLRVAIKGAHEPENATMKVDAAAGVCQVCLEKMDSRVVYCAQCRTPAHEECWSYMGMCSTYGCREIRFERNAS